MTLPIVTITTTFKNPSLNDAMAIAQVAGVDLTADLDALGLVSDLEYITDDTTAPDHYTVQRVIVTSFVVGGLALLVEDPQLEITTALRDTIPQRAGCQLDSITVVVAAPPT